MNVKKLILILLVLGLTVFCFAKDDKYSIKVVSADSMKVDDKIVNLIGNVVLELKTDNDAGEKNRKLKSNRVYFDLDQKIVVASGDVVLSEDKQSEFVGDSITLNWDSLDVVVFGGGSSTQRKNAQGNDVNFYTRGERVSYNGKTESVFYQNGVISTRAKDPYWSIKAKEIAIADSDLFFKNATFRLGRVPVFWLPVFFYPGTRLSINPAIGISSDKGMFFNSTFELYGVYPGIGATKTTTDESSSSSSSNTSATASMMSLLSDGDSAKMIRKGLSYKKIKEGEKLSAIETWARKTDSYFAITADSFQNTGLSLGFDTKNKSSDGNFAINGQGLAAFRKELLYDYYKKIRYFLDLDLQMKLENTQFSIKMPFISDPNVKIDFLNRNTAFSLDSAFGKKQTLPTTYSSSVDEYQMVLQATSSHQKNGFNFSIGTFDAKINYKWGTTGNNYKYSVKTASLPYFTISSSGNFLDLVQSDEKLKEKYKSDIVKENAQKYDSLQPYEGEDFKDYNIGLAKPVIPDTVSYKDISDKGHFKLGYTYSQTFDNSYVENFKHSSLYTYINSAIKMDAKLPGKWFAIQEDVKPVFTGTLKDGDYSSYNFKLQQALSASVPIAGLTYNLTSNVYVFENVNANKVSRPGEWNKDDVSTHNITFSKSLDDFTFGLKQTLKPVAESTMPSVSYSNNGFSASGDITFNNNEQKFFDPSISHVNSSFSKKHISVSISNSLDHQKEDFAGYTGNESFALNFFDSKLRFTQDLALEKKFKVKTLSFGTYFKNNSVVLNFTGEEVKADSLKIVLGYSLKPFYLWKHRIGFESSMDTGFTYDFNNKYGSSFYINFNLDFIINKFISLKVGVKSSNNSFYRYYDSDEFKFNLMFEDLKRSFDFFGTGRTNTGFNLNALSVAAVHNMEDWKLTMQASSKIVTVNGKQEFKPEISVLLQWNALPELKVQNKYGSDSKWENN